MAKQAYPLGLMTLGELDQRGLDRVRAIYEDAFPVRQRQPFEELVVEHAAESGELAFIAVNGEVPLGFCFLSRLRSARHLFLTYFAVDASNRGAGVGRGLWAATLAALQQQGETDPIVLEVEPPDEAGRTAAEAVQRSRRFEFWRGLGAQTVLKDGYDVPNFDGTGTEPMCVMRFGETQLESSELLAVVLALYRDGYGLEDRHPLVRQAQERLG